MQQDFDAQSETVAVKDARIAALEAELAEARRELATRSADLANASAQQTAISEVLGVISRTPSSADVVLNTIATTAKRLCKSDRATIWRLGGDRFRHAASSNQDPEFAAFLDANPVPTGNASLAGRCVLEKRTLHVHDMLNDPDRPSTPHARVGNARTMLDVPLLRHGEPLGVITLVRTQVQPFAPDEIGLVETFADQAVIAIENARLLDELQTQKRELEEALANQTAMAEVLKVISHSPTNSQPVFDAIAKCIRRLTGSVHGSVFVYDGEQIDLVAFDGFFGTDGAEALKRSFPQKPGRTGATSRAIATAEAQYIRDVLSDPDYAVAYVAEAANYRSIVSVPMLQDGRAVGAVTASHGTVDAFGPKKIELLKAFADQALIAMNNARLFEAEQARTREVEVKSAELQDSLEYQTAISQVLAVISRSPRDLQPVFDAIAESSARLCDALFCLVGRYDGQHIHIAAQHNNTQDALEVVHQMYPMVPSPQQVSGRVILSDSVIQVEDVVADSGYAPAIAQAGQWRSILGVPLRHNDSAIGVITVMRAQPGGHSQTRKSAC
jgi:GAF domain-containing protein